MCPLSLAQAAAANRDRLYSSICDPLLRRRRGEEEREGNETSKQHGTEKKGKETRRGSCFLLRKMCTERIMAPLVFFSLADGYMGSDKKEEDNADNRTEPSFIASTKKKSMSNNKGDGDASIIIPTPTKAGRLVYDSASGFVTQYIVANVCRKLHSSSFCDDEMANLRHWKTKEK